MNKGIYIILSMLIILLLISCDPVIYLTINGKEEIEVKFDCGKILLVFVSVVGEFQFHQKFEILSDTILKKENLIVTYNGEFMDFELYGRNGIINTNEYIITEDENITVGFLPPNGVKQGDIIKISPHRYIICNDQEVDFEELIIILEN